ncbi:16S rRNA (cytosine(967)-C(5))-methyltransferase RsmB [Dokdonella fugitiva]|uniref:16S rRNA (cytosine(967)-C(5))-methyltransferase RsmB n=1 Tax=Dokdonella fugitiva TaxID=328517 RepID=UPI0018557A47|nr:16S rRNA (cytosine967-C5)-methyltransferase [Dokdonella fugitiva]
MSRPPQGSPRRARAQAVPPGAALRADAARALARVALDGASLRSALAEANPRIADARDRALLAATLFEASRWWLRFDAALARLLDKPLPPKAREVRALLVLAFAQVAVLGLPEYAVVAASVEAVRALGQPQYAGLANALLRRFLRERASLEAELDRDPVTRHAHPRWLVDAIERDWPGQAAAILAANNREAPLTLRLNRRRTTREALLARLADAGIAALAPDALADAIVLAASADVTRLPGYAEGAFSVQDGAAQRVADLLAPAAGMRVLDACAAPGGKSAHLLERADIDLVALDADPARLPRVRENLDRLGLAATIVAGDAGEPEGWWDGKPFQRILVDAPCSATGIVRRQPDIKLHRRGADVAPLVATQARLLAALWPLLAPGGRLLYATCSLLRAENEGVLAEFLRGRDDARAVPLDDGHGHAAGVGRQNLPGEGGMDGFYYALVEKQS